MYVNGSLPKTAAPLSLVYAEHQADDGLLYVTLESESTYG